GRVLGRRLRRPHSVQIRPPGANAGFGPGLLRAWVTDSTVASRAVASFVPRARRRGLHRARLPVSLAGAALPRACRLRRRRPRAGGVGPSAWIPDSRPAPWLGAPA